MKKILVAIFCFFIFVNILNAQLKDSCPSFIAFDQNYYVYPDPIPYSLLSLNWNQNWQCFNQNIKNANKDIENYWKNDIKPIIDEIKDESEKRKNNLETIKKLEKERLLVHKEMEFLLKQEVELLSNQADLKVIKGSLE